MFLIQVFHVGLCESCEKHMKANSLLPVNLFLRDVRRVLDYMHDSYPTLRVIMWDDMFRGIDLQILQGHILFGFPAV